MRIALIEPFYTGSHRHWADGLIKNSTHDVQLYSMPGRYWKWRMRGAAITLAREFNKSKQPPDLILATDMLDLSTFLALTRPLSDGVKTAVYFHENQVTYPWSPDDKDVEQERDFHYGLINLTSALAADVVFFNSKFHQQSFLQALPEFMANFPDFNEADCDQLIEKKSRVLYPGLDLHAFEEYRTDAPGGPPVILWNHRWEYDKNPAEFFAALAAVDEKGHDFRLIVAGESFRNQPPEFAAAKVRFGDRLLHWGKADTFAEYAHLLWQADIIPITSQQENFGISLVEACYCGAIPLCPQRLTYPELLPAAIHETSIYSDFDDLVNKLEHLLIDHPTQPSWAKHFDWSEIRKEYDDIFS